MSHNASLMAFVFPLYLTDPRNNQAVPGPTVAVLFLSQCGWLDINKAGNGEEEIVAETRIFSELKFVFISLNLYFYFK